MRSNKQGRDRRRDSRRPCRRGQSHQESHSQGHLEPLGSIAAHPLASQDPPTIVRTGRGLTEMIRHLRATGSFAFDSEFIGERSYEPLLCLVQAATTERVFLVDPLAGLDLSDFWDVLTCGAVEKIVLAGQQDFGPAALYTGRPPANVVDVQIAGGFVHGEYPLSLSRLVAEFVGVSLGKPLAFTHWDNRPLSAVQVRYACDDVRYLPAAHDAIGRRLAKLGRKGWAREECAAALEDISLYKPPPQTLYLRVRGRDRLGRRPLAVLRELAIVRAQAARRENVPARTLLKDAVLVATARRSARRVADLDDVRGLPKPVESRYGRQIVDATRRALALPEDKLPPGLPVERPGFRRRVDKVWAAVGQFCLERSIAVSLVASRKEVFRFCHAAARGHSVVQHRLSRGWRKELLGDLMESLL